MYFGDNYRPIDAYFVKADGEIIRRKYNKGERRNTNQTLPRLAFQIFESQINALSDLDMKSFPICRYTPEAETICGIFKTVEEFWVNHFSYGFSPKCFRLSPSCRHP